MTNELKEKAYHHMRKWFFLEVILPLAFVGAIYWPLGPISIKLPHLFERVFSSADLLPLSALILLGVTTELEQDRLFDKISNNTLENFRFIFLVSAVLLLYFYGSMKTEYLKYTFPNANNLVDPNITVIGVFSISSMFYAIGIATCVKVISLKEKTRTKDGENK